MSKKRIYEVAKELGVKNQQVIDVLQKHNIEAKNNFNTIDEKAIDIVKKALKGNDKPQAKAEQNGHQDKGGHGAQNNRAQDTRANEDRSHDNRNNGGKQNHRKQSEKQEARHNDRHEKRDNNRDGNRKHDNAKNEGRHGNGHDNNRSNDSNRGNDTNRNERNDRRNKRGDNHGDDRRGKNDNRNDRRNKKDKKNRRDGNRPQSLLSTSLAKSKNKVKQRNEQNRQHKEEEKRRAEAAIATAIELDGPLTVKELADKMGREVSEIIKKLMFLGVMATINQEIDVDTATIVAEDFGVEVTEVEPAEDPTEIKEIEDAPETLQPRPPVVTIMGHVDHGKTSLLDVIRQTNVTAHEAGGITQHIGAYMVRYKGNKITFLDTPGHEAFTAMRLRGAQSTDIAVLVVAADDGVMPQTIEAINHAKSANVPVLVAINKMDKPGANPDHVKQQLAEHGLLPEEWGGDTIMVPVSAKKRQGIDDLLENILLVAEVMELKANPNRHAQGVVIEAKLDKGRGPVCTVLVQKGTLRVGDTIIAGTAFGKVRAMTNERGEKVKAARPSMPVEVLGLSDVPQAGEIMDAVDDNEARTIAEKRIEKQRVSEMQRTHKVTLDDIFNQIQQGELKDLNIIIKADVQGSVEALRQSLEAIKNPEVRIVIVHAAVGAINESDVMLASASNAIIIGFNVRPDALVRKAAEKENVDLRTYRVIYDAINDVENAMRGMLTPEFKEVILGRAEVRQVISTPKAIVAGSYVTEGKITNNSEIRLIRDGIVVHEGKVDSLRRFKDEVKEVKSSFECGISIEKYRDIKEGDVIEAYVMEEITPQL
ncbi:translation initiation factor IF-2 [uncultured Veillonella sp.]|uniref:translation initiation factor IF-2 n=1 Tax=uncultured Veillonella sp. TaxID=159268 RepID=UPI00259976B5|nr:translation initiation factor IF-2 [uncultured Veillonella sp.]